MRSLSLFFVAVLSLFPSLVLGQVDSTVESLYRISAERVLKVQNKDVAAEKIIAAAENCGGYMLSHLPEELHIKIPTPQIGACLAAIDSMGFMISKTYTSENVTMELYRLQTAVSAKQATYNDYVKILQEADTATVYSVEKSLVSLQAELDYEKGQLSKLEHQLEFADARVSFVFKNRIAPNENMYSSFRWLNSIRIATLQSKFH